MRQILGLVFLGLLTAASSMGCGSTLGYPTAKAVTVLNQPGECAYCHRKIAQVGPANLVTFDGVEYIVCDEKCAAGQKSAPDR